MRRLFRHLLFIEGSSISILDNFIKVNWFTKMREELSTPHALRSDGLIDSSQPRLTLKIQGIKIVLYPSKYLSFSNIELPIKRSNRPSSEQFYYFLNSLIAKPI